MTTPRRPSTLLVVATWVLSAAFALGHLLGTSLPDPRNPLASCGEGFPLHYSPPLEYGYFCVLLLVSLAGFATDVLVRSRSSTGESSRLLVLFGTVLVADGLALAGVGTRGRAPFHPPAALLGLLHLLVAVWWWTSGALGRGWRYARRVVLIGALACLAVVGFLALVLVVNPFTPMGMTRVEHFPSGADVPQHISFVPKTARDVSWFTWDAENGCTAVVFRFDPADVEQVRSLVTDVDLRREMLPDARQLRRCGFDLYDQHWLRRTGLAAVKWDAGIAYFYADNEDR